MPDPVSFPGIAQIRGCWYTLTHGISPGVAILEIVPQTGLATVEGTLELACNEVTIGLHDCLIESRHVATDQAGVVWRLVLFDRRWKWNSGELSGSYNQRDEDGVIVPGSEKTPAELAELCLIALSETVYDVSAMPTDRRPAVAWDRARPAKALGDLADSLDCNIILKLDNSVALVPRSGGAVLPIDSTVQYRTPLTDDGDGLPGEVATYAGLKAVDLDGSIQQVAWSVTLAGATTTISCGFEAALDRIGYAERRWIER
ncbi:MAG TPA: hypothetical protein VG713_07690 [Pirellulales bacterium]|nr:hypothetical protein [Pirellulales bacterium]